LFVHDSISAQGWASILQAWKNDRLPQAGRFRDSVLFGSFNEVDNRMNLDEYNRKRDEFGVFVNRIFLFVICFGVGWVVVKLLQHFAVI
jgi:hypothetical protein